MRMPTSVLLRTSAVVAATALALTGCSAASGSGNPSSSSADTREITDVMGTVQIPTAPERIVAADENAALNLLAMGITPEVAYRSWNTTVPVDVLEAQGIEVLPVGGSSIYPELEDVASQNPDLVVITTSAGQESLIPDYDEIAPTVHALYTATWQDVVTAYGGYFDEADRAEAIVNALTEQAAQVAAAQPAATLSLSVLMSYTQGSMILAMDDTNAISSVITDAGFTRPAVESVETTEGTSQGGWTEFSPEQLAAHDADIVAVTSAANYDVNGVTGLPLYGSLAAVQAGRAPVVDGDLWSGGSGFATFWVLADLQGFVDGEDTAGDSGVAEDRWDAFTELIGR